MKKIIAAAFLVYMNMAAFSQPFYQIKKYVIKEGEYREIDADYNLATGEITVMINGIRRNFNEIYPYLSKDYAASASWFINNDTIVSFQRDYVKFGKPTTIIPKSFAKTSVYKGVGVYLDASLVGGTPGVIFIPVRPGEFQPYTKYIYACASLNVTPQAKTVRQGSNVTFTANVTGIEGKVVYTWRTSDGKIISGADAQTLTVSTTDFAGTLSAYVDISVEGRDCRLSGVGTVEVRR